jgi:hypothetical protein
MIMGKTLFQKKLGDLTKWQKKHGLKLNTKHEISMIMS